MVTVSGEAGVGKTTFVEDFLSEVDGRAVIARGRCSERLAETDAFAPLLDALGGLARADGEAAHLLQSTAPSWHAQVTTAQRKPPSHERMRREFATFFEELARLRPVILFLDDLDWADVSTCDLLAYVGQRIRAAQFLVITRAASRRVRGRRNSPCCTNTDVTTPTPRSTFYEPPAAPHGYSPIPRPCCSANAA